MKKMVIILSTIMIWSLLSACTNQKNQNPDEWLDNLMEESLDKNQENNKNLQTKKENMIKVNQTEAPKTWDKIAIFDTNMWKIKVKLFPEATPKTYENFVWLAKKWYYDWTIFHRVINNFMIQWWDPNWTWMWWASLWNKDFEDEPNPDLKNIKWALSMANRGPNTNWSQFFIVQASATPYLDGYQNWKKTCGQIWTSCHTVFWQVFEWLEIVNKIAETKVNMQDKPLEDIIVNSITISDF